MNSTTICRCPHCPKHARWWWQRIRDALRAAAHELELQVREAPPELRLGERSWLIERMEDPEFRAAFEREYPRTAADDRDAVTSIVDSLRADLADSRALYDGLRQRNDALAADVARLLRERDELRDEAARLREELTCAADPTLDELLAAANGWVMYCALTDPTQDIDTGPSHISSPVAVRLLAAVRAYRTAHGPERPAE